MPESQAVVVPTLQFRRFQCDYDGRGETGKRLKDCYLAELPNGKFLVTNFSGAMVVVSESPVSFQAAE